MCGRYITAQAAALERAFNLGRVNWTFEPSYNVAPTQQVPVVRPSEDGPEGLTMRWGLIPFFARGVPPKYSTINATIEKLETGATWKGPWSRAQRCLQLAAGFYEWHLDEAGRKNPFFIHVEDQEVFAFAGLWDRSYTQDGTRIESCALITMPGNELMRRVHNTGANPYRMPAILAREDHEVWLSGSAGDAHAVLKPYPPEVMIAYQVSTRVNSSQNDDYTLIEPVQPDPD
jgi:putative SOS response-associated peptidase YedK